MKEKPLKYQWIDAIFSEDGPNSPKLRSYLHFLTKYMQLDGSCCFPSQITQAKESHFSRPYITKYAKLAEQLGWIKRESKDVGHGHKLYTSIPLIPDNLVHVVDQVDMHNVGNGVAHVDIYNVGNGVAHVDDERRKRGLHDVGNGVAPNRPMNREKKKKRDPKSLGGGKSADANTHHLRNSRKEEPVFDGPLTTDEKIEKDTILKKLSNLEDSAAMTDQAEQKRIKVLKSQSAQMKKMGSDSSLAPASATRH